MGSDNNTFRFRDQQDGDGSRRIDVERVLPDEPETADQPCTDDDPRMHITVNGEEILLHAGLRVKHAIGPHITSEVREWRAIVRDGDGNIMDVDGALSDGLALYITEYEDPSEVMEAYGFGRKDVH